MKNAALFLIAFLIFIYGVNIGITTFFSSINMYRNWDIQSIDTMKYSRDLAREQLKSNAYDYEIDKQMKDIAATGATHVAIGTPYDPEFLPILKRWVAAARKNHLKVWFKGNFAGWEGWFGYQRIDKATHTAMIKDFVEKNSDLFMDGDIFTSCPECENGSPVEYGNKQSIELHRSFLLNEYAVTNEAFTHIRKNVKSNYYSMNGDVAKAMMDKETTKAFGGVVVVDHYVKDPKQIATDLRELAKQSGGTIVLGEFGAPIPDIHGKMTEDEQEEWLKTALHDIAAIPQVNGVNYWVNKDGSTALWKKDGSPKSSVAVITQYFRGRIHIVKYSN
jgi:hypothetical protein